MRAALIPRNGPPQVLELGEIPIPPMGDNQVLVRVHASSVNPIDCGIRRGGLRRFASVPFPIVPGVDLSGVAEKCGKDVSKFSEGDEVYAFIPLARGASAEYAVCDESWLSRKPALLSHTEAAVMPCVGLTALQGLRDKARLRAGEKVLVVGASGGVGTMAVQIACAMGAEVTGVCSTANIDMVRRLGAKRVIDYTRQHPRQDSQRFDAIFDCVGNHQYWIYRKLLKSGGRHVGISCSRRAILDSVLSRILPGGKSFQFHVRARSADLGLLGRLNEEGKLKPIISHVYTLASMVEAHCQCETRRTVGKIAVTIA